MKKRKRKTKKKKWTAHKFVRSVWGVMKKQEKKSPAIKLLHKALEADVIKKEGALMFERSPVKKGVVENPSISSGRYFSTRYARSKSNKGGR